MFSYLNSRFFYLFFFFQAEDGIRDKLVTGVQTCALPISPPVRKTASPPTALHPQQAYAPALIFQTAYVALAAAPLLRQRPSLTTKPLPSPESVYDSRA